MTHFPERPQHFGRYKAPESGQNPPTRAPKPSTTHTRRNAAERNSDPLSPSDRAILDALKASGYEVRQMFGRYVRKSRAA